MDPAAIRELIAMESGQFDSSLEYWLGASFAVVVAAHAARDSMRSFHRWALASVYAVFCLATFTKAWADLNDIFILNDLLVGTPLDSNTLPNRAAAFFRLIIYLVFSTVVTIFVFRSDVWASKENPS